MQSHKTQVKNRKDFETPWDEAINDAERKLKHTEMRTKRLRAAIETFKAHKRIGSPWPQKETAGTAVESAPAKG